MIELNPHDNQGVRDILWTRLLELNRLDELEEYLEMYEGEYHSAFQMYSILLAAIKRNDDENIIIDLYKNALNANEHVPDYLTGKNKMPLIEPMYYSPGDRSEAVYYVLFAHDAWSDDEIAMEKLKELMK